MPHETWTCPACGRDVEIEATPQSMKARGYWMPPSERELVAVCARQHHAHRRFGGPLVPPEPTDPELRWRPFLRLDGGVLLVLSPPAGFGLRPIDGDRYEVVRLDHLEASDLVGDPLVHGSVVGVVDAAAVVVDEARQLVDWEALGSTPSASA